MSEGINEKRETFGFTLEVVVRVRKFLAYFQYFGERIGYLAVKTTKL